MNNLIQKTILAGLGALSLTKEKAEKITKDLIKQGELAKNEEAKFIKDLMEKAKKSQTEMENKINEATNKVLKKINIPTRKEFESLKAKVDKLLKK